MPRDWYRHPTGHQHIKVTMVYFNRKIGKLYQSHTAKYYLMRKGEMDTHTHKKMLHPKYMFLHKRRLIHSWAFRLLS